MHIFNPNPNPGKFNGHMGTWAHEHMSTLAHEHMSTLAHEHIGI
jgi:hypothetical protein